MKKILVSVSALALLFATGFGVAGEVKLPKDGPTLSVTFPDDWVVEPNDDDDGVTALSKDEAIEIDVWAVDKEELKEDAKATLEAMGEDVAALIDEYIVDLKTEKPVEAKQNGVDIFDINGKGKDKESGAPVNFSMTLLSTDNKNIFVMLYWGSDEAEAQHIEALTGIVQSVKKL